mmetsp:Transcript_19848/g.29226  ORF Transcript_19848/g.29226 Transcript_19848/m.29226 type:complete len:486 (-) Transcript_19848:159-1616(-)
MHLNSIAKHLDILLLFVSGVFLIPNANARVVIEEGLDKDNSGNFDESGQLLRNSSVRNMQLHQSGSDNRGGGFGGGNLGGGFGGGNLGGGVGGGNLGGIPGGVIPDGGGGNEGMFRFHKMDGAPDNLEYPLSHAAIGTFASDTNAVSMRLFSDFQVQEACSPYASSFTALKEKVYTRAVMRPTHPDDRTSVERDIFWMEFEEIVALQYLRNRGVLSRKIFPVHPLFSDTETIDDSAQRVRADFPTDFPTALFKRFASSNGGVTLDPLIFEQCSYKGSEFVNGPVAIGEIIGWAVRTVSPAAFASKWYVGRARPEEVAWEISQGGRTPFDVPSDIQSSIHEMNLTSAADFTAYEEGSPVHPSYPAMHSAASSASTWMAVVADLTDDQKAEARLLDYSIAYYRSMAGVHYASDNRAGLALGQKIMNNKLPGYLADKYGCSPETRLAIMTRVLNKIEALNEELDWATYSPPGFQNPVQLARRDYGVRI